MHELEPWLEQEVRGILAEHGEHLDLAGRINQLRAYGMGRNIQARVEGAGAWYVGLVIPTKGDNTEHAVLLGNGKAFLTRPRHVSEFDIDFYQSIMSPKSSPLTFEPPAPYDIAYVEKTMRASDSLPIICEEGWNAGADPEMTELVIGLALEIARRG